MTTANILSTNARKLSAAYEIILHPPVSNNFVFVELKHAIRCEKQNLLLRKTAFKKKLTPILLQAAYRTYYIKYMEMILLNHAVKHQEVNKLCAALCVIKNNNNLPTLALHPSAVRMRPTSRRSGCPHCRWSSAGRPHL